jgi:Cu/Ag efflux protein CusF
MEEICSSETSVDFQWTLRTEPDILQEKDKIGNKKQKKRKEVKLKQKKITIIRNDNECTHISNFTMEFKIHHPPFLE